MNDQAVDRCHRIGQTKPVTVYVLVAADTVDETIYRRAAGKKEKSESLLGKGGEEEGEDGALDGSGGRRCVRALSVLLPLPFGLGCSPTSRYTHSLSL